MRLASDPGTMDKPQEVEEKQTKLAGDLSLEDGLNKAVDSLNKSSRWLVFAYAKAEQEILKAESEAEKKKWEALSRSIMNCHLTNEMNLQKLLGCDYGDLQ